MRKIGLFSYLILFVAFVSAVNYFQINVKEVVESHAYQSLLVVGKNGAAIGYEAFLGFIDGLN